MGAPTSTQAEILQICMLAGRDGQGRPLLDPQSVRPITQFGIDNWPHAVNRSILFLYTVPQNSCLIVTYLGFYTGLADGSDPSVNFGIPVSTPAQWTTTKGSGTAKPYSTNIDVIAYVNTPCFWVFSPGVIPKFSVARSSLVTVDSLFIKAQMQGYLVPASTQNVLAKYQTVPVTT